MPNAAPRRHPLAPIDAEAVLAWYDRNARTLPWRVSPADRAAGIRPDPYRVWLSEIMLQQTTVAAVARHYARFTALWPTVRDLAAAPLEAVLVEWAGLGYYARARNLHACARAVVERFASSFPCSAHELSSLPGIGTYTSAAVSAIAGDERIAVVDGNVDRLLARYLALEQPVREAKPLIRNAVQDSVPERAGDFAQALMDLGATICTPKVALCPRCPLQPRCTATHRDPLRFPVRVEKPIRPTRYGHAFVIFDGSGRVFLRARRPTGLLGGMTETPTSDWAGTRSEPLWPAPAGWRRLSQVVHIFTHFRLELDIWSATIVDPSPLPGGWWADPAELHAEALPTVFRKVLAAAGLSPSRSAA